MNYLGKALVLITLALSVVFMTWAVVLFLSPVDWGRKEARQAWVTSPPEGKKEPNERLAARIDERLAGYKKLRDTRGFAVKLAERAENRLARATGHFGFNHKDYVQIADYLWQAPGDKINIMDARYNKDGSLVMDKTRRGMPLLEQLVPEITKSYKTYQNDLAEKGKAVEKVTRQIEQMHTKQEKVTAKLNGMHKGDKVVEPGYYDLLETEAQELKKLKEEVDYLQPLWVYEVYNAGLLRNRRESLEKRLRELGQDPSTIRP